MNVDISEIDRHLRFLQGQAKGLRERGRGASWAEGHATQFDQIAELLRRLRQEQQMTGMGGKRLDDNGSGDA